MTAAKVMDIISRLPGCAGQAADAVSAYTQVKWSMHPNYWKFPNRNVQTFGFVYQNDKWPKSWSSMEDPVVPLERHLYGHPLAGLLWERQFEKVMLEHGWEESSKLGMLIRHQRTGLFLSVYLDDIKLAGKETEHRPNVENTRERRLFGRADIIPWPCLFLLYPSGMRNEQRCCGKYRNMFESRISAGSMEKLSVSGKSDANISSWSFDMEGHAKKCVQRNCELAQKKLNSYTESQHHALTTTNSRKKKCDLYSLLTIVLKCVYLAILVDLIFYGLWTNLHDQSQNGPKPVTNAWIVWSLTFITQVNSNKLGLFQDSDFAGDLEDTKSTSGGIVCIFGSHTFVPRNWICKKQTSVSHSSTEAELISLGAGLRKDGIPALDLSDFGDWSVCILPQTNSTTPEVEVQGKLSRDTTSNKHTLNKTKVPTQHDNSVHLLGIAKRWLKWSSKAEVQQWDMYPEPTELLLVDCLTELIWTHKFQIKYVDTKHQLADILTKGNFHTRWVEQSSWSV